MLNIPGPERGPVTKDEKWTYAIILIIVIGLFIAEVVRDYEPIKLAGLLVVAFWIPLLALHEAGHAVAAWLCGWHVGQVVIGMGRILGRFRVGSASVEVRLIPVEGFVRTVPKNLNFPRIKSAFIYFAGPGSELLLAGLLVIAIGPSTMFSSSDDYLLIICQSLAVAATVQAVINLVPIAIVTQAGRIPNDGLGIIVSFMQPESHYAEMIGQTYNPDRDEWESYDSADWWKRNDRG